jgi:hypothetical protein
VPRVGQHVVSVYLSALENNELEQFCRVSGLSKSDTLNAFSEYKKITLDLSKLKFLPREIQEIAAFLKDEAQQRHLRRLRRMARSEWKAFHWIDDLIVQRIPGNPWLSRYYDAEIEYLGGNGWPLSCTFSQSRRRTNRAAFLRGKGVNTLSDIEIAELMEIEQDVK